MLRVVLSTNWGKYYAKYSLISFVQTLNTSLCHTRRKMSQQEVLSQMPGQHENENLPSDFPTITTEPSIFEFIDVQSTVENSPFVLNFDVIPSIRPGENPPTPSPSPTAPRTDSPEFTDPPNISPTSRDAPRPPTSPPGQPEAFPPRAPDATPPKQPPDPGEQIRTSNVRFE
ncbi:sulfated surface glycoprotein isoform X1 [Capsicum galapagoense]